jgi:hypothetical protein
MDSGNPDQFWLSIGTDIDKNNSNEIIARTLNSPAVKLFAPGLKRLAQVAIGRAIRLRAKMRPRSTSSQISNLKSQIDYGTTNLV